MKRFAKMFAANYISMVLLSAFLLFMVPEIFPGEPMPTGMARVMDWIAYPVDWFLVVYSFPFHFVFDRIAPLIPVPFVAFFVSLLVPATLWTLIFILARRCWRIYHHAA
jgi:hypothetical protein